MEQPREYYAFISYKREDEKWAKWLQDKLEHYRFPTNLNGRTDLPKNIRPTFRDVTDLEPGLLAEKIDTALRNSQWLIVVCSPRAAKSPWVCKEAQTFIDLGRADHIIPFVIEGNPFSSDTVTECYPEALLNLTGSKEILAANINEMGRDAAVIKVVARMFGLRFDALWQRYEREKRRRRYIIISLITLFVFVVLGIAGYIWWSRAELQKAYSELDDAYTTLDSANKETMLAKERAEQEEKRAKQEEERARQAEDSIRIQYGIIELTNKELNHVIDTKSKIQSRAAAEASKILIKDNKYNLAQRVLIEALQIAYTPETESVFRQAMQINRDNISLLSTKNQ